MKTQIYFVRHGKVKNPQNIWYGRLPRFGLDKEGILQLQNTANFFEKKDIDILYSSPLLRAIQSAKIIKNKLNIPKINISKKILEIKTSLQGSPFFEIEKMDYDVFASNEKGIKGETIKDINKRMQSFIKNILKKHKGKKVIAVSHGDTIMIVKTFYSNLPLINKSLRPGKEKYINHGEVYLLEFDDEKFTGLSEVFNPLTK